MVHLSCENELTRSEVNDKPRVRCSVGKIEIFDMPALCLLNQSQLTELVIKLQNLPCLDAVVIEPQFGRAMFKVPAACRLPDVLRTIATYLRNPDSNCSPSGFVQRQNPARAESPFSQASTNRISVGTFIAKMPQVVVPHVRGAFYLSLAGASFGMSIVGLIVPGIPTVPFLLLTSYFLVRSSPKLNARLLNSRSFGPLIQDWQQHRGMRLEVKLWMFAIVFTTIGLTLLFSEPPAWLLAVMFIMTSLSLYYILTIPTVNSVDYAINGPKAGILATTL